VPLSLAGELIHVARGLALVDNANAAVRLVRFIVGGDEIMHAATQSMPVRHFR